MLPLIALTIVALLASIPVATTALAANPVTRAAGAGTPAGAGVRAPSGPPLLAPGNGAPSSATGGFGADPLVGNGLRSPLCDSLTPGATLSDTALANCRTSGFVAAPAPTNNYGFDVHTESGFLEVDPASLFQEWVLSPVWMALVWIVHALIVALEWCYTLDLLHSAAMANVARALQGLQGRVTSPWLAAMLALASIAAAYHGLVRRRVAQTLGDALLMLAMMAGGLWVIADPVNTVGALGQLSNEASLGAFGVTVSGTPNRQSSPLAMGMAELFTTEVEGPWCYLEFGNVEWCRDPRQLDTRLRDAALGLAQADQARSDCSPEVGPTTLCVVPGAQQGRALHLSALLLRRARTNGELFLALPADSAERNSVQQGTALLHVLCGASEANACRGPTAPQAEFRTSSGTLARVEGLVLISAGGLGMVLLIGFIVLRLLEAALVTLLYLLLAPLAVLAPALGDGGRNVFRTWATRLLGAIVSKLVYSLFLGVVLLAVRVILQLNSLGWWIQWLLVSTLWWGAYRHRHTLVTLGHQRTAMRVHRPRLPGRSLARSVWHRIAKDPHAERPRKPDEPPRRPGPGPRIPPPSPPSGSNLQAPLDDLHSPSASVEPAAPREPAAPPAPVLPRTPHEPPPRAPSGLDAPHGSPSASRAPSGTDPVKAPPASAPREPRSPHEHRQPAEPPRPRHQLMIDALAEMERRRRQLADEEAL